MSDRPTVAGALKRADEAHQKILSHEELCALRYSQITKVLEELRGEITGHKSLLQAILLSVAGFALVTLATVVLFKSGLIG